MFWKQSEINDLLITDNKCKIYKSQKNETEYKNIKKTLKLFIANKKNLYTRHFNNVYYETIANE
jgi:hypothetical protein